MSRLAQAPLRLGDSFAVSLEAEREWLVAFIRRRYEPRRDQAEDIAQDTIIALWTKFRSCPSAVPSIKGYLATGSKWAWQKAKLKWKEQHGLSMTREPDEPDFDLPSGDALPDDIATNVAEEKELVSKLHLLNAWTKQSLRAKADNGRNGSQKAIDIGATILQLRDKWVALQGHDAPSISRQSMKCLVFWLNTKGYGLEGYIKRFCRLTSHKEPEDSIRRAITEHADLLEACRLLQGSHKRDDLIDSAYREIAKNQQIWLKARASDRSARRSA